MRFTLILGFGAICACSSAGGPYPTLQPRTAEAVDPRVPVERPVNDRPVSAALANRLAGLIALAGSGDLAFAPAIASAERSALAAGTPQSESWAVAQEALSGAVAASAPTARALADIDALTADALQRQGGIAPNDLAAIERASAQIGGIDRKQTARIKALQDHLGG